MQTTKYIAEYPLKYGAICRRVYKTKPAAISAAVAHLKAFASLGIGYDAAAVYECKGNIGNYTRVKIWERDTKTI